MKENLGSAVTMHWTQRPLSPEAGWTRNSNQIKSNQICSDLDSTSWRQTLIQCNVFQINYPLGYLKRLFRKLLIGSIVLSSAVQYSTVKTTSRMKCLSLASCITLRCLYRQLNGTWYVAFERILSLAFTCPIRRVVCITVTKKSSQGKKRTKVLAYVKYSTVECLES